MDETCPDCSKKVFPHRVSDHDMLGCTLLGCECELTGMFLREFFKEGL